MKLRFTHIIVAAATIFVFWGCSTKKDKFINRNWHALNTKYNVLYNGKLALEQGQAELNSSYKDDYWEVLPVERIEVTDEIKLDSEDNNPHFIRAEEKATKAVQKHSMVIKDIEKNPQIDEAFLLLGKARYFDQRYIPALESFNYILRKYEQSDKLNEAVIWREKTNMRLDNPELAIENLKRLFKYDRLKDQEYADAHAVMAQSYLNLQIVDTAMHSLKLAQAYTKKNEEKGRYLFILGQLYNQIGQKDSANFAFDKVIDLNRKSPRVYMINAHLMKVRNMELNDGNLEDVHEYLIDLAENRENRPFLDKIYNQMGHFYLETGSDSLALAYFDKSLRSTQGDEKLNALNYETLGEFYFDQNEYKTAGQYYDSVLVNLRKQDVRRIRRITKKRDNLEDVIKYEDIAHETDSIITVYQMSPERRQEYFEEYIQELKAAEEAEAERRQGNSGIVPFGTLQQGNNNKTGKFYFYNTTSLGYGRTDFKTRWGDRALDDDWRWSDKTKVTIQEGQEGQIVGTDSIAAVADSKKYDVEHYLSQIPTDPKVIDSLKIERNVANYQLGLIYKEKFKENLLAAGKLEEVLDSEPEERLILPSKYNLYKIYSEEGSPLADQMKQDILANHGDSRYAEILRNPDAVLANDENSPDANYTKLYKLYEQQKFAEVIRKSEGYIDQYTGDHIVPKFELLKAQAAGRLKGFETYKEALNYISLAYPNNEEGKKAAAILSEQLPKLASKDFVLDKDVTGHQNWKLLFPFTNDEEEEAVELKERLQEILKELRYKNKVSKDVYDLELQFVTVHGFRAKDFALGFAELIKKNKDYLVPHSNFVILAENYKVILVHKNLDAYQSQVQTPKP